MSYTKFVQNVQTSVHSQQKMILGKNSGSIYVPLRSARPFIQECASTFSLHTPPAASTAASDWDGGEPVRGGCCGNTGWVAVLGRGGRTNWAYGQT